MKIQWDFFFESETSPSCYHESITFVYGFHETVDRVYIEITKSIMERPINRFNILIHKFTKSLDLTVIFI